MLFLNNMNSQSNKFTCRKCGAKLHTKMKLLTHESNHNIDICDLDGCEFKATDKKKLFTHLKCVHKFDGEALFEKYTSLLKNCKLISRKTCKFCKSIVQLNKMREHIYMHMLKKNISCKVCNNIELYSYEDFLNHKRVETENKLSGDLVTANKTIKCEICFVYVKDTHIRSHYNNHKNTNIKCKYCNDDIIYTYENFVTHFTDIHVMNTIESFVNTYMTPSEIQLLNTDKKIKILNSNEEILNKFNRLNVLLTELHIIHGKIIYIGYHVDNIFDNMFFKNSSGMDNILLINNLIDQLSNYINTKHNTISHLEKCITHFRYILGSLNQNSHLLELYNYNSL